MQGLVPNVNRQIQSKMNPRLGRKCCVSIIKPFSYSKTREASFTNHAPKLFNVLPKQLRNETKAPLAKFKSMVDNFLKLVPDEPQLPNYTICRRAESNSIIHMVEHITENKSRAANPISAYTTEIHAARGDRHNLVS